jgi:hypothetical protein
MTDYSLDKVAMPAWLRKSKWVWLFLFTLTEFFDKCRSSISQIVLQIFLTVVFKPAHD